MSHVTEKTVEQSTRAVRPVRIAPRLRRVLTVEHGLVLSPGLLQRLLPDVSSIVKGAIHRADPGTDRASQLSVKNKSNQSSNQQPTPQTSNNAELKEKTSSNTSRLRILSNQFPCNICRLRFPSRRTLNEHRLTHDCELFEKFAGSQRPKSYPPVICKQRFELSPDLRTHKCTKGIPQQQPTTYSRQSSSCTRPATVRTSEVNKYSDNVSSRIPLKCYSRKPKVPKPSKDVPSQSNGNVLQDTVAVQHRVESVGLYAENDISRVGTVVRPVFQQPSIANTVPNEHRSTVENCSNYQINKIKAEVKDEPLHQPGIEDPPDNKPVLPGIVNRPTTHYKENMVEEIVTVKDEPVNCYGDVEAASIAGLYAQHEPKDELMQLMQPRRPDFTFEALTDSKPDLTAIGNPITHKKATQQPPIVMEDGASLETTRVELYAEHETKDELVIGPMQVQRPANTYAIPNEIIPELDRGEVRPITYTNKNRMNGTVTVKNESKRCYDTSLEVTRVGTQPKIKEELVLEPVQMQNSDSIRLSKIAPASSTDCLTNHNRNMGDTVTVKNEPEYCDDRDLCFYATLPLKLERHNTAIDTISYR